MKKCHILILVSLLSSISIASDVDSLNLKYMYEGAKEIEMLNRSMEAGMQEHNQNVQPVLVTKTEHILDKSPIEDFQNLKDKYYLEKVIENPKNTTVEVKIIRSDMVKITTTTTKKEHITTTHGMGESSYSSSTVEELPIPFDADSSRMTKEYKNGILKISIPKKRK